MDAREERITHLVNGIRDALDEADVTYPEMLSVLFSCIGDLILSKNRISAEDFIPDQEIVAEAEKLLGSGPKKLGEIMLYLSDIIAEEDTGGTTQ